MKSLKNALFMFIFGIIFMAIGLAIALLLGVNYDFKCTRATDNQGVCQYIEKKLLSNKVREIKIDNLKEAEVKQRPSSGRGIYSVQLYLYNGGSISITGKGYSSGFEKKNTYANEINRFIKDKNLKTLDAKYDGAFLLHVVGGIFALFGGLCTLGGIFTILRGKFL